MISHRPSMISTSYAVIFAVSGTHLINDLIQFLLPALYPVLKSQYNLSYYQLGLLTLAQQITACLLQPALGLSGDVRPRPYSLAFSMAVVALGVVLLAVAESFAALLMASAALGLGSALFHPEASRVCRMASGGRFGFAQSSFQVGGNVGTALGPLAAALIVLPFGQAITVWFGLPAVGAMVILLWIGRWFTHRNRMLHSAGVRLVAEGALSRGKLTVAFAVLGALLLSKFVYIETFKSYYAFFLIEKYELGVAHAQGLLFVFLAAVAIGTYFGGPIGDHIGRKKVIWVSIVGALPFAVVLPHVSLWLSVGLSIVVGLVLSSAFSAIVVFAQELLPQKVGMVSGFVFGFAFGVGALGAAALGALADQIGMEQVFDYISILLCLGFLTALLPDPTPSPA